MERTLYAAGVITIIAMAPEVLWIIPLVYGSGVIIDYVFSCSNNWLSKKALDSSDNSGM